MPPVPAKTAIVSTRSGWSIVTFSATIAPADEPAT
jgi:hypothetical protein